MPLGWRFRDPGGWHFYDLGVGVSAPRFDWPFNQLEQVAEMPTPGRRNANPRPQKRQPRAAKTPTQGSQKRQPRGTIFDFQFLIFKFLAIGDELE